MEINTGESGFFQAGEVADLACFLKMFSKMKLIKNVNANNFKLYCGFSYLEVS